MAWKRSGVRFSLAPLRNRRSELLGFLGFPPGFGAGSNRDGHVGDRATSTSHLSPYDPARARHVDADRVNAAKLEGARLRLRDVEEGRAPGDVEECRRRVAELEELVGDM